MGAGLVVRGQLYGGASGRAGELGHVPVKQDGRICRCGGRGCLETVVGAHALLDALGQSYGRSVGLDDLVAFAERGDAGVRRLLADAGRAVGSALVTVCTMLDPDRVVVGGKLGRTGDVLLDAIRETLRATLPPVTNQSPTVVAAALGERAESLGAVQLARRGSMARFTAAASRR